MEKRPSIIGPASARMASVASVANEASGGPLIGADSLPHQLNVEESLSLDVRQR